MLITPGIHENLGFSAESKINEKGTLILVIESKSQGSLANSILEDKMIDTMKSSLMIFPPNTIDYDTKKSLPAATILADLLAIRDKFMRYAELVATPELVKSTLGGGSIFTTMGVPVEGFDNYILSLSNKDVLEKVMKNLSTRFLDFMTKQPTFLTVRFRQKFIRQSKKKHFASIPFHYSSTIIEPMTIPLEVSDISWSTTEISNGKDNGAPVAADLTKIETVKKSALFGQAPVGAPTINKTTTAAFTPTAPVGAAITPVEENIPVEAPVESTEPPVDPEYAAFLAQKATAEAVAKANTTAKPAFG